ncbi:MAG: Mannose permease IID component [Syntrophaceae bacterium PtaU1.Bin231]|nr:MAG: Mannose permease IID component [Syntrophaceae bacterium PtaU1.Bin231]
MRTFGLVRIFLRALLVQGSLNFSRMQNLGFAFALMPWIRAQAERSGNAPELLRRHLQYFNTHPYFVAPIAGAVLHMEHKGEEGGDEVARLKTALMGPYAAIGDSFFWGALKPLSSIAAFFPAFIGMPAAPIILLILYNPAHIALRIAGFAAGWRSGKMSVEFVRRLELPELGRRVRQAAAAVLGVAAALALSSSQAEWLEAWRVTGELATLPVILLLFVALRRGISRIGLQYGLVGICGVLSYFYG